MAITTTSFGHSAIRLDHVGGRLVIDPGLFSAPEALEAADAILITHDHADHLDTAGVATAAQHRPDLRVWGPASVVDRLLGQGVPANQLFAVQPGDNFDAAGFPVSVLGGQHAEIHPDLPASENVSYLLIGRFLHTGDALPTLPDHARVEVLFLPVSAPWLKLADAINYAQAVNAETVVPVHDGILSDAGKAVTDQIISAFPGSSTYKRLVPYQETIL